MLYHTVRKAQVRDSRVIMALLSPFYTPVEDGTYYVITHGRRAGGVPHSSSGAYLQDYASYSYETSWVDRSHQVRVQCTGTITLACLMFELLPFVYFHT